MSQPVSELKRYSISYWDDDCEVAMDINVDGEGEWCQADDALREIATRDARIAYLESQVERWQDAVMDLAPDCCYADQIRHEYNCDEPNCEECGCAHE